MSARIGSRVYTILVASLLMISTATYGQTTWYVDDDAPGDPEPGDSLVSDPDEDGSAAHPFDAIQEAIDASADGDTVMVLDGTYTGIGNKNIQHGGKAITVRSENGPNECIVDCERDGRGFYFGDKYYSCPDSLVLDGFTIRNGYLTSSVSWGYGGGIYLDCDATVRNCVIENNESRGGVENGYGGGIYCPATNAVIEDCIIRGNAANVGAGIDLEPCEDNNTIIRNCTIIENVGEGIHLYSWMCNERCSPKIIDCTISNNTGTGLVVGSDTLVANCVISNNTDDRAGGGIYCWGNAVIVNCLISDNAAGLKGGGVYTMGGAIIDCTIVGNHSGGTGGGVDCCNANVVINNSILQDNTAPQGAGVALSPWRWNSQNESTSVLTVSHSLIQGGVSDIYLPNGGTVHWEEGNIETDTVFPGDSYHLAADSPCIDAGDNNALPADTADLDGDGDVEEPIPLDLDGQPRVLRCRVDLGAYEAVDYPDCNENGVSDGCEIADGTATDWDGNGVPDDCDPDCNGNGFPDGYEIQPFFHVRSQTLSPLGAGSQQSFAMLSPPEAEGQVDVRIELIADLDYADEWIDVELNGVLIDRFYETDGVSCPDEPQVVELQIAAEDYNEAVAEGEVAITIVPSDQVDPDICDPISQVTIDVSYLTRDQDCNDNGVPDDCDISTGDSADCNDNGIPDDCEIADGTSVDCNENSVLDECDLADGTSLDCNENEIPDECEPDCNGNGVADDCDIRDGTSPDCNGNGIPDECEPDCNANGIADECDIAGGASPDCNWNGVPDECELADGTSADCNENGILDECDINAGVSQDCNNNGIPDECEIDAGSVADCNENGIPDECEPDCNGNGVADECDIADGTSLDADGNGVPDECEDDSGQDPPDDDVDIDIDIDATTYCGCGGPPALAIVLLGLFYCRMSSRIAGRGCRR